MTLDADCLRDVLIYLEDNLTLSDNGVYNNISTYTICGGLSDKYTHPQIRYTVDRLEEAGFIKTCFNGVKDGAKIKQVYAITYEGHIFLDSIKPASAWSKIKSIASKIGYVSVPILSNAASSVLTDAISKFIP